MEKKSVAVLFAGLVLALVYTAAVQGATSGAGIGDLKQFNKRSDNATEMGIEEATKTCNESFAIKMGK